MSLKEKVGLESQVFTDAIEAEKLAAYAAVTHWKFEGQVPPNFLTSYREAERELSARLGIPIEKVLHAEQEYEILGPLAAGDRLDYSARFDSCIEKKGSRVNLKFMAFVTEFRKKGSPSCVAKSRMLIVVRDWDPPGS